MQPRLYQQLVNEETRRREECAGNCGRVIERTVKLDFDRSFDQLDRLSLSCHPQHILLISWVLHASPLCHSIPPMLYLTLFIFPEDSTSMSGPASACISLGEFFPPSHVLPCLDILGRWHSVAVLSPLVLEPYPSFCNVGIP